jgi:hypothetical protein
MDFFMLLVLSASNQGGILEGKEEDSSQLHLLLKALSLLMPPGKPEEGHLSPSITEFSTTKGCFLHVVYHNLLLVYAYPWCRRAVYDRSHNWTL